MSNGSKDRYNDGWANGYRKTQHQTQHQTPWETILIVLVALVFGAAFLLR